MNTTKYNALKINFLIAQKNAITAKANFEAAKYGEWRSNHAEVHAELDKEIFARLKILEKRMCQLPEANPDPRIQAELLMNPQMRTPKDII